MLWPAWASLPRSPILNINEGPMIYPEDISYVWRGSPQLHILSDE